MEDCGSSMVCLFSNMSEDKARQTIKEIASQGAKEGVKSAMKDLGLDGEDAPQVMAAVKAFFHSYKNAGKMVDTIGKAAQHNIISLIKKAWNITATLVLTAIIIGIMLRFGFDPKIMAQALKVGQ